LRILQIDKFLDATAPASGGLGTYMPVVTAWLRRAGHSVLHFGCVPPGAAGGPAAGMPPYVDYRRLHGPAAKLRGALRILHDFSAAAKLEAFLARNRVDVAHVHRLYHHLTPSILPSLTRRGIPVVMSVRDYRLLCPVKAFLRRGRVCMRCMPHRYHHCVLGRCAGDLPRSAVAAFETAFQRFFRRYVQAVEAFLCPSRFMADCLAADGVPAHKIELMPNPIQPLAAPADTVAGDGATILYVGRLSEEKGPDLMLDLAEALPAETVTIVGEGPMRPWLQSRIEQRGLRNIRLTGHVPHDRLGRHYAAAAVVVVPSRCLENSPHTLLEGMLAGRCVVAPDHGPIREWVRDGRTGRTFRPGDAADLVGVVGEVLADPRARQRMGRAGRELVRRRHDPDEAVGRLLAVYERVVRRCESP